MHIPLLTCIIYIILQVSIIHYSPLLSLRNPINMRIKKKQLIKYNKIDENRKSKSSFNKDLVNIYLVFSL